MMRAALVQQRSALRALPQTPGSNRASYARPLTKPAPSALKNDTALAKLLS
jgi:hypothetical protein